MSERGHCVSIYPGSFDPVTKGHEDIVRRALSFCDVVIVAVAHTATQRKSGLFSIDERLELLQHVFRNEPRIRCTEFEGLLVDFARAQGASIVVRGLRAISDFEYEFQMALMNRQLWSGLETVFLAADAKHSYLSASLVREIASLGGDVSDFVDPVVLDRLHKKLARK